jgi:hypothetical protein
MPELARLRMVVGDMAVLKVEPVDVQFLARYDHDAPPFAKGRPHLPTCSTLTRRTHGHLRRSWESILRWGGGFCVLPGFSNAEMIEVMEGCISDSK